MGVVCRPIERIWCAVKYRAILSHGRPRAEVMTCALPRSKAVTCHSRLRGGTGQPCEPGRGEPPSRAAALAARAAALPFLSGWPCGCGCGCDLPVLLPRKFGVRTCASLRQRENLIYFGGQNDRNATVYGVLPDMQRCKARSYGESGPFRTRRKSAILAHCRRRRRRRDAADGVGSDPLPRVCTKPGSSVAASASSLAASRSKSGRSR